MELSQRRTDFSIECLCTLLRCVGPSFEQALNPSGSDANAQPMSKVKNIQNELNQIWLFLKDVSTDKGVKPRTRFMVMDLFDLKSKGWKDGK